jgi:hypothetical protein
MNERGRDLDLTKLAASELTEIFDSIPGSFERLEQARGDILDGRTFQLAELEERSLETDDE